MTLDAPRQAAIAGFASAGLFALGNAIWALEMPEDGTPVAEIVEFYRDTDDRIVIGGSLSLLAIGFFVWFAAAVRELVADAGEDVLATTAFGGALLGMAAGLGAEGINLAAALRSQDGELSGELAQALFEIPQFLGAMGSALGLGVFALATAAAALRSGAVLPRPLALVLLVAGVVLVSPLAHVNWVAGALMVALAVAIAVALLRGSAREATSS